MRKLFGLGLLLMAIFYPVRAGVAYPDPGWTYVYEGALGTNAPPGSGFVSLDGTWSHDNASDEWDASAIGGEFDPTNAPGGLTNLVENSVTFLRIQDTGDPRAYGFSDPGSNRKIYFEHDVSAHGITNAILDEGFTLSFRARIPTNGPLDVLHLDQGENSQTQPYPAPGDGHLLSDSGKGFISVGQIDSGLISFCLNTADDSRAIEGQSDPAGFSGMTLNEFAGNFPTTDVNFGQGTGTNKLTFPSTAWHEFWIVLRQDPEDLGTHEVFIYMDGSTNHQSFKVTASPEVDLFGVNYIGIGSPSSSQSAALDLDFVAYLGGIHLPPGATPLPNPEPLGPVELLSPELTQTGFTFSFVAQQGKSYRGEYKESLSETNWVTLGTLTDTIAGSTNFTDTAAAASLGRFSRVVSE